MNKKVIKLLTTATLATALMSFFATAEGLKSYVFTHYWQAGIISAAIQGTLFALSIKGSELQKGEPTNAKWALRFLWGALLVTSSVFSFVFIARVVYSDRLLVSDAQLILEDNCFVLDEYIETVINGQLDIEEKNIREYIDLLITDTQTVNFSQDEIDTIKTQQKSLNITPPDDIYNLNLNNAKAILGEFSEGKFTEVNYQLFISVISETITAVDNDISILEKTDISAKDTEIEETNKRLAQFHDVREPMYLSLNEDLKVKEVERDNLKRKRDKLIEFKNKLISAKRTVEDLKSHSLANNLYSSALKMYDILEQKDVKAEDLLRNAADIHKVLLENNVPYTDERMRKYSDFLDAVNTYDILIDQKENINEEVNKLYGTDSLLNKGDKSLWTDFWNERLSTLKDIIKILPKECMDTDIKNKNIQKLTNLKRLYLLDLNDFELEFSLLFGKHRNKGMLAFSLLFAFGIDLFSLATGRLITKFKEKYSKPQIMV